MTPKLADFGFARTVKDTIDISKFAGTVRYKSWDVQRLRAQNQPEDVWAAGVILCDLFGFMPFASVDDILDRHAPLLPENLPAPLRPFLEQALHHERQERFQSGQEMLDAFVPIRHTLQTERERIERQRAESAELALRQALTKVEEVEQKAAEMQERTRETQREADWIDFNSIRRPILKIASSFFVALLLIFIFQGMHFEFYIRQFSPYVYPVSYFNNGYMNSASISEMSKHVNSQWVFGYGLIHFLTLSLYFIICRFSYFELKNQLISYSDSIILRNMYCIACTFLCVVLMMSLWINPENMMNFYGLGYIVSNLFWTVLYLSCLFYALFPVRIFKRK